jgi:thiamine biosynthesis protein ThiS
MIAVRVNGEERHAEPGTTVGALVREVRGAAGRGIAVARNEVVVPRSCWDDTDVSAGDRIEILDAAQGG